MFPVSLVSLVSLASLASLASPASLVSPVFPVSLVCPACPAWLGFLVRCLVLEVSRWADTSRWGGAGLTSPLTLSLLSPQWVAQKLRRPQRRLQRKLRRSVSCHLPFPGREEGCLQMGRVGGTPGAADGGDISGTPCLRHLPARPHP